MDEPRSLQRFRRSALKPFLLSYKKDVGTVAIEAFNSAGKGTREKWRSNWSNGWTHMIAPGEKPYLFSYKNGRGDVNTDRIAKRKGKGAVDILK